MVLQRATSYSVYQMLKKNIYIEVISNFPKLIETVESFNFVSQFS